MGERSGIGNREWGIGPKREPLFSLRPLPQDACSTPARAGEMSEARCSDSRFPIPDSLLRRLPRHRGFTLLEVLIALLILALVLVALIRAAGLQAQALNHHRDSTLAQWVAANVAAELRSEGAPPVGRQQGEMQMGPQRWRWLAETEDTDVERLRRIEIRVYAAGEASLAGGEADPVARLTAFASP